MNPSADTPPQAPNQPDTPNTVPPQPPTAPGGGTVIPGGFTPPVAPGGNVVQPYQAPGNQYAQPGLPSTPGPMAPSPMSPAPTVPAPLPADMSNKSFMVTFLLALLLGTLGADRFYLGKIGTGILKLLTFGGLGVWVLVDIALTLTGRVQAKDGSPLSGYEQGRKPALIIFGVWILIGVMITTFSVIALQQAAKQVGDHVNNGTAVTCDGEGCSTAQQSGSSSATPTTPVGTAASADGLSVTVTKVIANPSVTGDQPDAGMQYVEIDLAIKNTGQEKSFVPGSFYYHTSSDQEFSTANTLGNAGAANKKFEIPGRAPLVAVTLDPGQTDSTRSLVYQVPKDSTGTLVWREFGLDPNSKTFAIFALD